ncbi:hypothetical protein [Pseudomonas reactans]
MTQLHPQVHAHNSNVSYQSPTWEQSNKPVQFAQQLLNLPSGLVTDLRNTLDALVMGRHSESMVNNLVSDLKRFMKFSPSENVLTEMKEVRGEQLKEKFAITPEMKAALESAPNVMTGEQMQEKFGITPEKLKAMVESAPNGMMDEKSGISPEHLKAALEPARHVMMGEQFKEKFGRASEPLSALTRAETKVLSTDDQRMVSSLVENMKNNPDTPVLGDKLYPVVSEVVANLRRYLDAEASGGNVDSAALPLHSSLQVLFGTDNSEKR